VARVGTRPRMPLRAGGFKPPPYTDSGTRASVDATPTRMRAMLRRSGLLIVGVILVAGLTTTPAIAVSFGPIHRVSPPYAWNPRKSLVATPTKLLTIWATDCPPPSGRCADDNGPRMGVFLRRSPAARAKPDWSPARRLSPGTRQAERPSIASAGTTVIASYVTQRSYLHYRASDPRELWVRVRTDQGKAWRSPGRPWRRGWRVHYPRVAIGGGRLFAVWTASGSGDIRLAWSGDLGRHWSKATNSTCHTEPPQ